MGRVAGKNPAFQFYPKDWTADTRVLSPTACGVWINTLCAMWAHEPKGLIEGTVDELARATNATKEEFLACLHQFQRHKICDIEWKNAAPVDGFDGDCPRVVTLMSRRMVRDENERRGGVIRKRRQRKRNGATELSRLSHALSPSPVSLSCTGKSPKPPQGAVTEGEALLAVLQGTGKFPNLTLRVVCDALRTYPNAELTADDVESMAAEAMSLPGSTIGSPARWISKWISRLEVLRLEKKAAPLSKKSFYKPLGERGVV